MVSDREKKIIISEAYSYFDFELQIEIFMDSLFFFPLAVRQIHILIYHSVLLEVRTTLFDSWFVAKLLTLLSNIIRIQVRMKMPRPMARAEEQKIKYSLTELMILQQSINGRAA